MLKNEKACPHTSTWQSCEFRREARQNWRVAEEGASILLGCKYLGIQRGWEAGSRGGTWQELGGGEEKTPKGKQVSSPQLFLVGGILHAPWKSELPLKQARDTVLPAIRASCSSHEHVLSAGSGAWEEHRVDTGCLSSLSTAVIRH